MAEVSMPAAEAAVADAPKEERAQYEFAFHILPTVAEEEVPSVVEALRELITKEDGEIKDEETPERLSLAYEIVKSIDGTYHRFHSAYFGWMRFLLMPEKLEALKERVDQKSELLRFILVRLSKEEEQHPLHYFEGLRHPEVPEISDAEAATIEAPKVEESSEEVSEEELDRSLEEITSEGDTDKTKEGETEPTK